MTEPVLWPNREPVRDGVADVPQDPDLFDYADDDSQDGLADNGEAAD